MRISDFAVSGLSNINLMNQQMKEIQNINKRLATGKKINSAADDPSLVIRMSNFETQIREKEAQKGIMQDKISAVQTAEQSLGQVHDIGQRLREIAIQYKSDTLSNQEKRVLENETKILAKEIGETLSTTTFNQKKLFSNTNQQAGLKEDSLPITKFDKISTTTHKEEVQITSKTYGLNVTVPGSPNLKGNFTLDLREGKNEHEFSIKINRIDNYGKLNFVSSKSGKFQMDLLGSKIEGVLELNNGSTEDNLDGTQRYRINGGPTATVGFELKSTEEKVITVEEKKEITLLNLGDEDVSALLNTDYIDKNILNPITSARAHLGLQQRQYERRMDQLDLNSEQLTKDYSMITDADMAYEKMNLIKHQLLLQNNMKLFEEIGTNHRAYISNLLYA